MIARVQHFGSFRCVVEDQPVSFPTRPTESLCAYLSSQSGRSIGRQVVAEAVWPDIESDRATNRLRTTLVFVKKSLDPFAPIRSDRQTIHFSAADQDSDLILAESLYRRSRVAQNVDEERGILQRLLAIIGTDFLADWTESWTDRPRLFWREKRIEIALRLASIGIAIEDYQLAENESLRALSTDDFSEEAWSAYLRATIELGSHSRAIERFGVVRRRRLTEIGFDFSGDLLRLAKRVSTSQPKPSSERNRFSQSAREVLSNTLEQSDPHLLLPVLASDTFKKEALRKPFDAWKLLCDVVDRTEGTDEVRIRVMRLSILLAGMVDQYGTACDYAEWIIENLPESNVQHRHALNMLGFMNFEFRDWEDAWRHLHRYLEISESYGQPVEVAIAKSQIASLRWHSGEIEEALEDYRSQIDFFEKDESLSGLYNYCCLQGNMGTVFTILGRWPEAKEYLMRAHTMAIANGFDFLRASITAQMGLAQIMTGEKADGRKMAAIGLAQTYRSRYRRMHQISADYAAGAMAASGYPSQGMAVLDAYTEFRADTNHSRSVAEERFAQWIREEFGNAASGKPEKLDGQASEIVADSCEILESN